MTFMPGQELNVTGLVKSNPVRFSINVGHNMEIIALHFDARFNYRGDKHTIVLNSKQGGPWQEEQRESNFPFEEGKEFQVRLGTGRHWARLFTDAR
ncbi:hypothetical protein SKAU_G00120130 [Synaphobranchus kaupii]|uniref:Galectin n=1 Tax=Synaphobranchus kaupii TaxID=118154 RepID=A0A9Q1J065_SYNKA|nr:hypothetical protein SKAU_G00120130 [Synaphobranchus kaupii]